LLSDLESWHTWILQTVYANPKAAAATAKTEMGATVGVG